MTMTQVPSTTIGLTSGQLIGAALCLLFLLFCLARLGRFRGRGGLEAPPVGAHPLMTPVERQVCHWLESAVPCARVHAQVSMGAILHPKRGLDRSNATTIRNRFSSKRVDFVLEDRNSGAIIALVELDDRTHDAADAKRDRLAAAAGYLTIRLPASERPTALSVRQRVIEAMAADTSGAVARRVAAATTAPSAARA